MSFLRRIFSWIWKRFFAPKKLVHSTIGGENLDEVEREIAVDGPLKPKGRRKIIRDPRLLPKPQRRNPWEKPPRVMSKEEARRRFSKTFRTRSRVIRDLLADEAQLQRHGLPLWKNEAELAAALSLPLGQLQHFATHRNREQAGHYVRFAVPKASGGQRIIMAPKRRLKAVHRELLKQLVGRLPVHDAAHGFVPLRSTKTAAEPHVGKAFVLRVDLKDFFASVTFTRVRGYLIAMGYGFEVATSLAVIMTECERQPVLVPGTAARPQRRYEVPVGPRYCVQGAPTSPGLCNAIAHKLDARLAGLAASLGLEYTRYADDLSFSGDDADVLGKLLGAIGRITAEEGFEINRKKTRVMRRGQRQEVVGVCVNDTLGLSRKQRRRIRAMIHRYKEAVRDGQTEVGGVPLEQQKQHIEGWIHYAAMLNPEQAKPLKQAWR